MEEMFIQVVETVKENFIEIVLAASFIWDCITGKKTEAQKKAKQLAKHTKARNKAIEKAEKEQKKIKELEKENASGSENQKN